MPTQAAAKIEVSDESVTQILGREIVQRCGCSETSSDRGNVTLKLKRVHRSLRKPL
jgi:hypothetical protein